MSIVTSIRAFKREAWILYAGTFINRFGSFVIVFLILYLTGKGYSVEQAGFAVGVYGVGTLIASLVGGQLADHLGRRSTIALSMFSAAVVMMAFPLAERYWNLVTLAGLAGLTSELYRPASAALLTDLTIAGQRVPAFAMYRLAINLGMAFGPAVGGFLAGYSFVWIFVGDALTSAAFGVVALTALPKDLPQLSHSRRYALDFGPVLKDRRFVLFLIASLLGALVFFQHNSTFALQVKAYGFSNAIYGTLISLNGLIVLLLELPITSLTQRPKAYSMMMLGIVMVGIGFGATAFSPTVLLLAFTVVIWTIGEIIYAPVASAFVADTAPDNLRGRYQGAWGVTHGFGLVLGPTLGTLLFSRSPGLLWTACLLVSCVAALILLVMHRLNPDES
ncbi:MAG TPA: MFS transporter [Rhodothermales bacterium]|nr:MFS transporter [Rhodothermales bacterium]